MDKFKDQDSSLPAATDDKKKAIVAKTGGKTQVIINPPEKVDPQRGYNEQFKQSLQKHSVIIEKKTELVLQSKAARAEIPQETLEQVFKRGYKSLPLNSQLTREQYAMNRVNSFVAGGAAMVEDCDLLPIVERVRVTVGMKGTGGAARPHIKREKSVYNGKTVFHVVDAKGRVKHSTSDEFEAKKHLATKYNSYMESTLSPMKRFEGTKSLVKTYKDDTPGEGKKDVAEGKKRSDTYHIVNKDGKPASLASYADKESAVKDRDAKHQGAEVRQLGPRGKVKGVAEGYNDLGREYGGAYVKGRSDDARMTERLTRQAKAAATKAGKTFSTSAEYRKWHAQQTEKQGTVKEEVKKGLYYYVNKRKKAGTSRDKDNPKAPSAQDWKNAAKTAKEEVDLSELSNAVLARYKQKAGEQASAADKAGDFKKGNKRFSGIIKATNKQFDNDAKGAK